MNPMTPFAVALAASTVSSFAALTWTGAGDGISLYQEANWQNNLGATPGANTINPNTNVTAITGGLIEISSGTGTPSNYGGNFQTGNGNSLTVGGGKILKSNSDANIIGGGAGTTFTVSGATVSVGEVNGFQDYSFSGASLDIVTLNVSGNVAIDSTSGGSIGNFNLTNGNLSSSNGVNVVFTSFTLDSSTASFSSGGLNGQGLGSTVNLNNGSSWSCVFLTNGVEVNVDATSILILAGGGDPINSATNPTVINLEVGAQLTLASVAEFAEQGSEIFVNGVSYADNQNILVFDGNTATAVPEPSSSALIGLSGLGLILRRRR